MKKFCCIAYFSLSFLISNAQFDVAQYFTDTISFSYEECTSVTVKKKTEVRCTRFKFVNRLMAKQFTTTQITYWPSGTIVNEKRTEYEGGTFTSIDYGRSKIKPLYQYNSVTTPSQVFVLHLASKDQRPFASVSKYLPLKGIEDIRLYFPSERAAMMTLAFLKAKHDLQTGGAERGAGLTLQKIPTANCLDKQQSYVNSQLGFTLCLGQEEKAEERPYAKATTKYLTDLTIVSGYSDLPFYIFPIDYRGENDSLVVFQNYEDEFFGKIGADKFTRKVLETNVYTKATSSQSAYYVRKYSVTLQSGEQADIAFRYLLKGNSKFDALCISHMAPTTLIGAGYAFRSAAFQQQCVVLGFN